MRDLDREAEQLEKLPIFCCKGMTLLWRIISSGGIGQFSSRWGAIGATGAFAADIRFHRGEEKSLRQYGVRRYRCIQAEHSATVGTVEMHVLCVGDRGLGRAETENATSVGRLVRQTRFGKPLKDPVKRDPINSRLRILAELCFDISMAARSLC